MRLHMATKPIGWSKIGEIAFWGAVLWGIVRMAANYFTFTPYGVRSFSRAIVGKEGENTLPGILLGFLLLLVFTGIGTILYSLLSSKIQLWWGKILYGLIWFVIFGYFFECSNWTVNTLGTELTWFLSLGLFVGMSVSAEQVDVE